MNSGASQQEVLIEALQRVLGDKLLETRVHTGQVSVTLSPEHWVEVALQLRDHPELAFGQLIDLCGVDYLGYGDDEWETAEATGSGFSRGFEGDVGGGPGRFRWQDRPEAEVLPNRFAVVVQLLSHRHNRRLALRCHPPSDELPLLPSLIDVWNSVNWYEREAFDLFGIVFEGHPDLRRLLTDYGFMGHPFRKDFPLIGKTTVHYDEQKGRVVYGPVEIEPRVLVPRVIRDDSRYADQQLESRGTEQ
jgi:NADH-quinone oxidoreductase subunit C